MTVLRCDHLQWLVLAVPPLCTDCSLHHIFSGCSLQGQEHYDLTFAATHVTATPCGLYFTWVQMMRRCHVQGRDELFDLVLNDCQNPRRPD